MPIADLPAVAVIADAHFHDLEGDYDFAGIHAGGRRLTARSWADTRRSTRLYNESFAAFRHALEEIRARGIRHVVLLGDYSDDGQRKTTASLARLLADYRDRYQLSFYALPGNHDLFGPHGKHQSTRYVTQPGRTVLVTSDTDVAAKDPGTPVLTAKMYCDGYPSGLAPMADFGFFNRPDYLYWETPFGLSDSAGARVYSIASADGSGVRQLMDASYLVEPVSGLWLLMIDANVFEPQNGSRDVSRKKAFFDSSDAGWNALVRLKPFLVDWIADVTRRAALLGKRLLAFSHYPVLDPFEDAAGSEEALFGQTAIVRRTPKPVVAETLMRAGLSLHFSGHLHVNATSRMDMGGRRLTNVAVPSLVAFPAAFKIVRACPDGTEVETVLLSSLMPDRDLLDLYRAESAVLQESPDRAFDAGDYGSFTHAHMRALVLHRYLPHEWPAGIAAWVKQSTLADLCRLVAGAEELQPAEFGKALAGAAISENELNICSMLDLVIDWYCLRQAGALALPFLSPERMRLYRFLADDYGDEAACPEQSPAAFLSRFLAALGRSLERALRPDEPVGRVATLPGLPGDQ